jgi:hypothetical protein
VHAVARIAVVALTGCSFVTTSRPPSPLPDHGGLRCTETPLPILADVVLAAAATVGWGFFVDKLWSGSNGSMAPGAALIVVPGEFAVSAFALVVPVSFGASAIDGHVNTARCSAAKAAMRARGRDPDAPVDVESISSSPFDRPRTPGALMARDGERAAERGDCDVVRAIADQLRTMNEPATLDRYLHNTGVAQCVP